VVVGWVLMAFPLDAQLVTDMQSLSALHLTLLSRTSPSEPWSVNLTSLDPERAAVLAHRGWADVAPGAPMTSVAVRGEEFGVRMTPLSLGTAADAGALALVSLSVDEAARLPRDLQFALIAITLVGIVVFAFGSVFTARRVATPLRGLADAAERLGAGDYATPMSGLQRNDEIGALSQSFERMRISVAENQAQAMAFTGRTTLRSIDPSIVRTDFP